MAFLKRSLGEFDAFVGHILTKIRKDSQYQLEKIQDWTAHLENPLSILMGFDTDCASSEDQFGHTFYDGLWPSIKLSIDEISRQQMSSDNLVSAANRAKAKARIHGNQHLDQQYLKSKRQLKMNINSCDEQLSHSKDPAPL